MAALALAAVLGGPASCRAAPPPPPRLSAWLEGLADGAQALTDGDAARAEAAARAALAALPLGECAARAELTLGLALRAQRRHEEAAAALGRAAAALPEPALAAAARFEQGQALFYGGHPEAADATFAALAERGPGTFAERARWRRADALLEAGDAAGAARAYEALLANEPGSPAAPGARLALAVALRRAGDAPRAVATYRALWIDLPADPSGLAAGHALHAWRAAGGPVPQPTPEQRLERAGRLLELALPRRVLAALDKLDAAAPPPPVGERSALLRTLALLQLGRREEAEARAKPLLEATEPGLRAGAELVLARAAARGGRVDEAAARYRRVAASPVTIPGLPGAQGRDLAEDAAFLAAWLYYDARQLDRAVEQLGAYVRAHPGARRADDARWFRAWSLYRLGRRAEARQAFAALSRGPLAAPALYWQARLARGEAAREGYRKVMTEAPPGSWYALLAAGRLAALGEPAPAALPAAPPSPIPDGPGTGPGADALERAAQLAGAGLTAEAVLELRALAGSREARPVAPALAQLAAAAGDAELPFRVARDHLAPTRRAQRWLYPRAFAALLEPAAAGADLDPWLYLAVMRRESAFRPDARSGAGAVGLVQLMPDTAARLAAVQGLRPAAVRELERPEVSVPMGAAYLSLLVSRFLEPAVALAAYNGGPVPTAEWARRRAGQPLDVWVEDIPFRETRRYVKAVTADAAVYRSLWAGAALALDGERPVPPPREGVGF